MSGTFEPARAPRNLARRTIRSGRARRARRVGRAAGAGAARVGPARYAERAPRWDATYPFRAERAERELRRLVVPTAVRLVGRRDPRRGHAVVGVHGRASVCFRRERGRRTRGGRCQSPSRVSSRSRVAPEPPRRKRSCTRSLAACLGFSAWGIQAVDAPAACATPCAWSTEVGPGPPRLRVRESGSGRRQNARGGCGADPRGAVRPSGHLEARSNRKMAAARRPTPVFVGGLGKSQTPFMRFVPDAPSAGD